MSIDQYHCIAHVLIANFAENQMERMAVGERQPDQRQPDRQPDPAPQPDPPADAEGRGPPAPAAGLGRARGRRRQRQRAPYENVSHRNVNISQCVQPIFN